MNHNIVTYFLILVEIIILRLIFFIVKWLSMVEYTLKQRLLSWVISSSFENYILSIYIPYNLFVKKKKKLQKFLININR